MFFPRRREIIEGHNRTSRHFGPAATRQRACRMMFEHLEDRVVPTFLVPVSYAAGANPTGIAVADFNGDGKSDMAVVNNAVAGTVGIMLSNGDGTFQPKVDYAAGPTALDARAGDFNGDGKLDLAVVGSQGVNVLLGNGDGTFGAPTTYATGVGSHALVIGDFNNDGKLDIATMNSGTASVLLGNGDGTFQPHHGRRIRRQHEPDRRRFQPRRQSRPGHVEHRQRRHHHPPEGPRRRDRSIRR